MTQNEIKNEIKENIHLSSFYFNDHDMVDYYKSIYPDNFEQGNKEGLCDTTIACNLNDNEAYKFFDKMNTEYDISESELIEMLNEFYLNIFLNN